MSVSYATTKGLGPFFPTVIFNDTVFTSDKPFQSEDEAHKHAQHMLQVAESAAKSALIAGGFSP